jgi:Asp-tRNA(Asn)/Glu-tRNA(Gln) amidotransferase A subunit family amidase
MDEDVKAQIMAGKNETSTNYVHALRSRLTDHAAFVVAMDGMAAFLTPNLPIQAPLSAKSSNIKFLRSSPAWSTILIFVVYPHPWHD